ncbi:hypothetical protein N7494_000211 [Penicillium frequentans]|uniref:Uncharacterized protein n=1 Tax=Penicillium frequentans TaxID=3151616 RepID=A0AAD6D5L1_9EURO|nr:hypothetical protein N7494_000211 [Penicillium glabrum]
MPFGHGHAQWEGSHLKVSFAGRKTFYIGTGIISRSIHAPYTSNIKVTYEGFRDMTGERDFSGSIGLNGIQIEFDNGVIILGDSAGPFQEDVQIFGSMSWLQI